MNSKCSSPLLRFSRLFPFLFSMPGNYFILLLFSPFCSLRKWTAEEIEWKRLKLFWCHLIWSTSPLSLLFALGNPYHRVHTLHTKWQWPLSDVHSIMMENSAQPGEDVGCTLITFHYIYHHVKCCSVRSSWEVRYAPPISTLPLYVLCGLYLHQERRKTSKRRCFDNWEGFMELIKTTAKKARASS
jgi:hypothetical protein